MKKEKHTARMRGAVWSQSARCGVEDAHGSRDEGPAALADVRVFAFEKEGSWLSQWNMDLNGYRRP
jgi:hypothetical protein